MNKEIQPVINTLLDACGHISKLLSQGDINIDGESGVLPSANSSGEQQKPLDVLANDIIKKRLESCPSIFALSSEEEVNAVSINPEGEYLVSFDPLDGSSNIDVNMCVGTIFSILKKRSDTNNLNDQFLQKGNQQVAAGFAVYGPATTAIIGISPKCQVSKQDNIAEFRLENQEWIRLEDEIVCQSTTQEYAINAANYLIWHPFIRAYIDECLAGKKGERMKNYNMRWLGSMVADMYRIFKRGGIFIYPGDNRNPKGKIRLLYEANPISFLIELAGGSSTDGEGSILDIAVFDIHQKTPVMIGSKEEIQRIEKHYSQSI